MAGKPLLHYCSAGIRGKPGRQRRDRGVTEIHSWRSNTHASKHQKAWLVVSTKNAKIVRKNRHSLVFDK